MDGNPASRTRRVSTGTGANASKASHDPQGRPTPRNLREAAPSPRPGCFRSVDRALSAGLPGAPIHSGDMSRSAERLVAMVPADPKGNTRRRPRSPAPDTARPSVRFKERALVRNCKHPQLEPRDTTPSVPTREGTACDVGCSTPPASRAGSHLPRRIPSGPGPGGTSFWLEERVPRGGTGQELRGRGRERPPPRPPHPLPCHDRRLSLQGFPLAGAMVPSGEARGSQERSPSGGIESDRRRYTWRRGRGCPAPS